MILDNIRQQYKISCIRTVSKNTNRNCAVRPIPIYCGFKRTKVWTAVRRWNRVHMVSGRIAAGQERKHRLLLQSFL